MQKEKRGLLYILAAGLSVAVASSYHTFTRFPEASENLEKKFCPVNRLQKPVYEEITRIPLEGVVESNYQLCSSLAANLNSLLLCNAPLTIIFKPDDTFYITELQKPAEELFREAAELAAKTGTGKSCLLHIRGKSYGNIFFTKGRKDYNLLVPFEENKKYAALSISESATTDWLILELIKELERAEIEMK